MLIVTPYILIDYIATIPSFKMQYEAYRKLMKTNLNGKLCRMRILRDNIILVCNKNDKVIKLTSSNIEHSILVNIAKRQKYSYKILKIINTLYANSKVFRESSKDNEITFFIIHNSQPLFLKIITNKLKYNYKQVIETIKIISKIQSDAIQISIRIREKIVVYIQNKIIYSKNRDKNQKEYIYYFVTSKPEYLSQIDDIINKDILTATIIINGYNNYQIIEDEKLKISEDAKIMEGKIKTIYHIDDSIVLETYKINNELEVNVKYDLLHFFESLAL